jgi:hypothetical protein
MDVGSALLERARAAGRDAIAVVGTGKNVGKTVTVAAICDALAASAVPFGLCSIGRDGEANDALEGFAKPRLALREGTLFATARSLLPPHPAVEIVETLDERSAVGRLVVARVRAPALFEIAGPPSAAAMRRVVARLRAAGAPFVVIDGAVDRVAALRDGEDAVVIATGAAAGTSLARVVDEMAGFVSSLRTPVVDPARDFVAVEGALTVAVAAAFVRANERRQIVVRDPTRLALGSAYGALSQRLDLRCERRLYPVACTVAPLAHDRSFEPRTFLDAVAAATGLPCYDVYAGAQALPTAA